MMSQTIVHQSKLMELVTPLTHVKTTETHRSSSGFASSSSRKSNVSMVFFSSAAISSGRGAARRGAEWLRVAAIEQGASVQRVVRQSDWIVSMFC
jgi:hypothetical protein